MTIPRPAAVRLQRASVVWQAPAEGGIPRYMLIFPDSCPVGRPGAQRAAVLPRVGLGVERGLRPRRRLAAGDETLREKGHGQLVYNADEFRWGGVYFRRIRTASPRTTCTRAARSSAKLSRRLGAKSKVMKPEWKFAPDTRLELRPEGGTITTVYPWNTITYRYNRKTNTYRRVSVGREASDRSRPEGDRGAQERDRDARVISRRSTTVSKKHRLEATVHRQRQGVDRHQRPNDQGHVAQDVDEVADQVLRRERQRGHADGRSDVRPGHAKRLEGHDQERQGPEPPDRQPVKTERRPRRLRADTSPGQRRTPTSA